MNTDISATPTRYWRRLEDGRVQCDVCPRRCRLHEGQRGLCFVRGRNRNGIELYTYGRSSGFCVDPIEKKPLNHFLPGTPVLSFGTAGCNLACKFCQNWDMSKSREMDTLADAASPDDHRAGGRDLGCPASRSRTTIPIVFMEYAIDVAQACREVGVQDRRGDRRLHVPGASCRVLSLDGRRQRGPEGIHGAISIAGSAARSSRPCSTRSFT